MQDGFNQVRLMMQIGWVRMFSDWRQRRFFVGAITIMAMTVAGYLHANDVSPLLAADLSGYRERIRPFLNKHCVSCHDGKVSKGDIRLDIINGDIVNGADAALWKDALHRLETGEMPPEDEPQPANADREKVANWIRTELKKRLAIQNGAPGRVVMRRLSRTEYTNTLRDLLGFASDMGKELPPDTTYRGFDHIAQVQELSPSQLAAYLRQARLAINEAIVSGARPPTIQYRSEPELGKEGLQWRFITHDNPANLEHFEQVKDRFRPGRGESVMEPDQWHSTYRFSMRGGDEKEGGVTESGVWLKAPRRAYSAKGADWGKLAYRLPYKPAGDGLYRLRIRAGAKHRAGLSPPLLAIYVFKKHLADIEINADETEPQWYEFVFSDRDLHDVQIHSDDNRFAKTPVTDIVFNNAYENSGVRMGHRGWTVPEETDVPGVFIDAVEFEANFNASWPPVSHRRILFDSADRDRPRVYAGQVLRRFMSQAFRRPVRADELASKLALFDQAYTADGDFITAIREPLIATLVSPQFLFITEDSGQSATSRYRLIDYELASRLSYFLWTTMPDEELLSLAKKNSLSDPEVLRSQIDRMLADRRAHSFHRGFMSQWLGLAKLDDLMIEDSRWVVRTGLRNSMREEPAQLFAELLRSDASLLSLIDSDFAMLNERLAMHYGISNVRGNTFRKVQLRPSDHRGGLLTQAACMTITTDGMITSPIYRGKWIMETILDRPPPPPPPGVPPLEDAPVERLSLRDQMARHRASASCAACHKKIDPVGWPLERYSVLGEFSEYGWGENWVEYHDMKRNKNDQKPDLHGILPDGRRMENVAELKQAILEDYQDDFLRSLTGNMMIYALGRPLDISDDEVVSVVVKKLKARQFRARSLIYAVVTSAPFMEK